MFPKGLRRKMGDDLWDGVVDCYDGTKLRGLEPMFERLGLAVNFKFASKEKKFHKGLFDE